MMVDKEKIKNYAIKNTSVKNPLERKIVESFVDSILNSDYIDEMYHKLLSTMQNGNSFILFNSFAKNAININSEPFRSIIAYSMLKKDITLFELLSFYLFTGKIQIYYGMNLYENITEHTDETPLKYTDSKLFTDTKPGIIHIGFKNIYRLDDNALEYQTIDEMLYNEKLLFELLTLCKPARIGIYIFHVPFMSISGNGSANITSGIEKVLSSPFDKNIEFNFLHKADDATLESLYKNVIVDDKSIIVNRTTTSNDKYFAYNYEIRYEKNNKVSLITIKGLQNKTIYVKELEYHNDVEYFQYYEPILLAIDDNDLTQILPYELRLNQGVWESVYASVLYMRKEK